MTIKFENVTAVAKANVYFDGKVVSHTIFLDSGERKTLGVFMPGVYEFSTGDAEIMDITDGTCEVLLPGAGEFAALTAGDKFEVPADSKFSLRCYVPLQYVCSYVPSK